MKSRGSTGTAFENNEQKNAAQINEQRFKINLKQYYCFVKTVFES